MTQFALDGRTARRALAGIACAALASAPARATEGEQVLSGEATFTRDGTVLQIDTSTDRTVINWSGGFDIPVDRTVVFNQPGALSNVANYDLTTDPSRIDGRLLSNGGVWIINPVGVFFGDQAIVDVGRLVAGAGNVDADEFLAGVERWSDLTGSVEVGAGAQIRAADSVLLVGAAVANYGNVSAADGMIALVAGGAVQLARVDGRVIVTADRAVAPDPERWALTQTGTLDAGKGGVSLTAGDAYSLAINHTGITRAHDIQVAGGEDGVVSVSGGLDASDRSAGAKGGEIAVTGERVALVGAQLDASGDAGGGGIRVGGDLRGEGELPTAKRTYVDEASSLRADALSTGDGGTIIVWSDEATRFYGALSARGGAAGGGGGFAEISGASLEARGSIDLGASAGDAGTLLYDPKEIELHAGTTTDSPDDADSSDAQVTGTSLGQVLFGDVAVLDEPFDIYEGEIENTDASIVLEATHRIGSADTFSVTLDGDRSLTLRTRNDTGDATGATNPVAGIDLGTVSFETTGAGTITLATGTGSDTSSETNLLSADIEVANLTTAGGAVTVTTEDGDIEAGAVTTAGGAAGANGGDVTLESKRTGSVTVTGAIVASGAGGTTGAGGDGGDVSISANAGDVTVSSIEASGGDGVAGGRGGAGGAINLIADIGQGSVPPPGSFARVITVNGELTSKGGTGTGDADDAGALGGTGGSIGVSAGVNAGAGSIEIAAPSIDASGGDGTAGGGSACSSTTTACLAGPIRIEAHDDVTVTADLIANGGITSANGPGGAGGNGGEISVVSTAGNATYSGGLNSEGGTGRATATAPAVNGTAGTASIEGHGEITATLTEANVADLEIVETEVTAGARLDDPSDPDDAADPGGVHVSGAGITAEGIGAVGSTIHTITSLTTNADAPHLTYRLADPGDDPAEQIDLNTLAVQNVSFGAHGGALANARANAEDPETDVLLGRIQGSGATPHMTTAGNLQLLGTNIGDVTPLAVAGAGAAPTVEVTVAGDIGQTDADGLPETAGLVVSGSVALVEVTQRSASGDIAIDLPAGGRVAIDGTISDDGANRFENARITEVTTSAAGADFFFALDPGSATTTGSGEPKLTIASGAVDLGGATGGFLGTGDLMLEGGAGGSAIDAGGGTVLLGAGGNSDPNGAIIGSGSDQADVANAAKLVLLAKEGVGEEAAIRTSAAPGTSLSLAGIAENGDFRIVNESGAIAIDAISITSVDQGVSDTDTVRGIIASGDVDLDNDGRAIELRAIALAEDAQLRPHVQSGGTQSYVGSVQLQADAALVAGSGVTFANNIDSDGTARDLTVTAGGATTLGGNVGSTSALDRLVLTDAEFTELVNGAAGVHTVRVANGDFGAIDGPGSLELRGLGSASRIEIRDDVGANTALESFDADADRLVLGTRSENGVNVTSADRIFAGDVSLNILNAASSEFATIEDTNGGLTIASTGNVTMGEGEKLSVTGPLAIHAGDTATLGDLSATQITVDASQIVVLERPAGEVALQNGARVVDTGVDWVANDITTSVVPTAQDGAGAAPVFVLGSGAIRTGGVIPFDVIRFTPDGDSIGVASFAGPDGLLDLTGLGPRVVSDASNDVPQAAPPVLPGLAARPGDEPPTPPREVSGDELIGALHCRTAAGEPCAPPAIGDDPLASERALEIRQRYRALLETEQARESLRAAFAPLSSVWADDAGTLSRALAHDPELRDARARIADLAVALAQVELIGLAEPESERARRAIAADFAAATGVAGLDADAVLAAVDASGVAVLPD